MIRFKKVLCLLLALILSSGALSCGQAAKTSSDISEDKDLVVVQTPVSYSRIESVYLANRMETICYRALKIISKQVLTTAQRDEVNSYIYNNVLPMLQSVKVTKDELKQLIYYTDFLLSTAERGSVLVAKKLFEETYHNYIKVLGSERAGKILYHGCLLYLNKRISDAEAQYTATNDAQYWQTAEELRRQKNDLAEILGEKAFADAATVFYFATSLFSPHEQTKEEDAQLLTLTDEELLLLWQRQSRHLQSLALTDAQWQIAGDFFFAFLFRFEQSPFEKNSLESALWKALGDEELTSAGIGKVIPSLLSLYADAIENMTPAQINRLRTGNEKEKTGCLTELLFTCPDKLMAFLRSFSQNVNLQSEAEKQMLMANGVWEDYLAYSENRTPLTAEQLYRNLSDSVSNGTEFPIDSLENYLFGCIPYVTYVIFRERSGQS